MHQTSRLYTVADGVCAIVRVYLNTRNMCSKNLKNFPIIAATRRFGTNVRQNVITKEDPISIDVNLI